jgi:hypothetical protein
VFIKGKLYKITTNCRLENALPVRPNHFLFDEGDIVMFIKSVNVEYGFLALRILYKEKVVEVFTSKITAPKIFKCIEEPS